MDLCCNNQVKPELNQENRLHSKYIDFTFRKNSSID